jgi:ketosteroid isomerase-like protein
MLTFIAQHPVKYETAKPSLSAKKLQNTDPKEELLTFLEKWRNAWQTKDIKTYIDCYAPSFHNGKLNKTGWKARKSYLNRKYSFIRVTIHDPDIRWTKSGANISFHQTYQSDKFQTSGKKTLQLVKQGNRWFIIKELM